MGNSLPYFPFHFQYSHFCWNHWPKLHVLSLFTWSYRFGTTWVNTWICNELHPVMFITCKRSTRIMHVLKCTLVYVLEDHFHILVIYCMDLWEINKYEGMNHVKIPWSWMQWNTFLHINFCTCTSCTKTTLQGMNQFLKYVQYKHLFLLTKIIVLVFFQTAAWLSCLN
jgi:hypothetical protein